MLLLWASVIGWCYEKVYFFRALMKMIALAKIALLELRKWISMNRSQGSIGVINHKYETKTILLYLYLYSVFVSCQYLGVPNQVVEYATYVSVVLLYARKLIVNFTI